MPTYTTGELAKLCEVSVRTVQFYDTKGLLKPDSLTEGGRRLYSDGSLKKLRLICLFKALGLSLHSIKEILESDMPEKTLGLLLEEQSRQLRAEITEKQSQLRGIEAVAQDIRTVNAIPATLTSGIDTVMNGKKKLKAVHTALIGAGILMDILGICSLILWITKGIWVPFAASIPCIILLGVLACRLYYKSTAYICPECGGIFRPPLPEFLFSAHTPKTRKLSCPECGNKGYCIETFSQQGPTGQ